MSYCFSKMINHDFNNCFFLSKKNNEKKLIETKTHKNEFEHETSQLNWIKMKFLLNHLNWRESPFTLKKEISKKNSFQKSMTINMLLKLRIL